MRRVALLVLLGSAGGIALPADPAPAPVPAKTVTPAPAANRPFLGLAIDDEAPFDASSGLPVLSVSPHGPADAMGVRAGDRLLAVDGQKLTAMADLGRALERIRAGQDFAIDLTRDGAALHLTGTAAAPPEAQVLAHEQDELQAKLERVLRAPRRSDRAAFADVLALLRRLEVGLPSALAGLRQTYPDATFTIDVGLRIRSDRDAPPEAEIPLPQR